MSVEEIVYDSVGEAIRASVIGARQDQSDVFVCRGEHVGCNGKPMPCAQCYVVHPDDRRPWIEHVRAYLKGDA